MTYLLESPRTSNKSYRGSIVRQISSPEGITHILLSNGVHVALLRRETGLYDKSADSERLFLQARAVGGLSELTHQGAFENACAICRKLG